MKKGQGLLFPELESEAVSKIGPNASEYIEEYDKNGFKYEIVNVNDVTFKSGTKEAVHSWFRLTPSYSPELVRFFLGYFKVSSKDLVFDPFNGKGTTIVECQKKGIQSVAIELNPLLYNVTKWSLQWDLNIEQFNEEKVYIEKEFFKLVKKWDKKTIEEYCVDSNTDLPKIHNVFRWWQPKVLKELLILRNVLQKTKSAEFSGLYNVILSVISLDCANVHRNHPTISFDDNHSRQIDVWGEFSVNFDKIVKDLREVKLNDSVSKATILQGDSTELSKYLTGYKVDVLITSPPYPNRFSYIHTTRPQLFFMELIDNAHEATELDLKAIGGTWGRATSVLQSEFLKPNKEIEPFLDYLPILKEKNLLMCNYATKYFNMMHEHIKSLKLFVNKGFKGVYVVGNSRLSGIEIYTDIILAKIFEVEGFTLDRIVVFRKRGGKTKLYETGVCIRL